MPHKYAELLIQRYGSLLAAANTKFDPGTVTIRDDICVYLEDTANRQAAMMFPPYRLASLDDLMRIALQPYLR